jgi:hypothetical protein
VKRHLLTLSAILATAAPASAHHAGGCVSHACDARVGHKRANAKKRATIRPYRAWLKAVAWCESTNNPHVVSRDGLYHGLYQFDVQTWNAVGGHGLPSRAGRLEQSYRATLLRLRRGTSPWPVCG